MSEREEMLELADRIVATPAYSSGDIGAKIYQCDDQEQTDSSVDVILINANHRNNLAKALRSAATPAPGYAQGFEACRESARTAALAQRCERGTSWDMACTTIAAAIAALPAPAGVEVTESDLHKFMLKHSEEWDSEEAAAQAIFSRFTILAKPAQEGQWS